MDKRIRIRLEKDQAAYLVMILQARHDAALQRELHARSRGEKQFQDREAIITYVILDKLANAPELTPCDGEHGGPPCLDPECWAGGN